MCGRWSDSESESDTVCSSPKLKYFFLIVWFLSTNLTRLSWFCLLSSKRLRKPIVQHDRGPQGLMVLTLDHCSVYLRSPENLFLFVKMQTSKKGLFTALTSGPHETWSSSKATKWHQSDLDHMRRLWRPGLESDVNFSVDKHDWDVSQYFLTSFKWLIFITNTF